MKFPETSSESHSTLFPDAFLKLFTPRELGEALKVIVFLLFVTATLLVEYIVLILVS